MISDSLQSTSFTRLILSAIQRSPVRGVVRANFEALYSLRPTRGTHMATLRGSQLWSRRGKPNNYLLGLSPVALVFLLFPMTLSAQVTVTHDAEVLYAFRNKTDIAGKLGQWNGTDPCATNQPWTGITCSSGRVFKVILEKLQLSGPIDYLVGLGELRVLSVRGNALSGSIPDFTSWPSMQLIYLSENNFTGSIPASVSAMPRLARLYLDSNQLNGTIPDAFDNLPKLQTLNVENNQLSGSIPAINNSMIKDFNVSGNRLSGPIPSSLNKFNLSAFAGNQKLCGTPLVACAVSTSSPPMLAPSTSPSSLGPAFSPSPSLDIGPAAHKKSSKLTTGEIVAIVVGDVAALVIVTLALLFYYWRKHSRSDDKKPAKGGDGDKGDFSSGQYTSAQLPDAERSKLVFLEGSKHTFELEDLLRASAEMLGKGSFGTAYKAVLEDGSVVAVKRLKDVSTSGKKEFEQQMELIGNLKHPNVVPLRAYYYAKGEKLLVYDYQLNGSLYSLLHGNRGPGRTPLDWVTRLRISLGAARGLAYLHQECGSQKIPHGNIKSSNILLDKNYNACISDYGLALLMTSVAATTRMTGYRAPEHADTKRISQRADVYSFGVLLLELLTGKAPVPAYSNAAQEEGIDLPRWVHSVVREEWTAEVFDIELMRYRNIEEEMVGLLQIAMLCVSPAPDQRPKMSQVVKIIEDIRPDSESPNDDTGFDSHSQSPLSEGGGVP